MIINKTPFKYGIKFATENDVCDYCLSDAFRMEYSKNPNTDKIQVRRMLAGNIVNQPVFKFNNGQLTICKKHIAEINSMMNPPEKEAESENE